MLHFCMTWSQVLHETLALVQYYFKIYWFAIVKLT